MKRILLFVATNVAVLVVLSVVLRLFGVESMLNETGTELNLQALLIISAVIGFAGSFISLAMSKWIAKRSTGARVIDSPRDATERWLLETVQRQARTAGIGEPEVAVYDSPDVNAFATGANRNNALVAVSTGLLRSMDRGSVEAVLGHEVSHVANGDMVTLTLILLATLYGTFLYGGNPYDIVWAPHEPPGVTPEFPVGTDYLGRDIMAGLLTGGGPP